MIEKIVSQREDKIEHTWIANGVKADHDGAKLKMLKDKINELADFINNLR